MKFIYSNDNKRYHTLSFYNNQKYGEKVLKASINAGLTCPNIDGKLGVGGCVYCEGGSGYFTNKNLSIKEQISAEIKRQTKNGENHKFIAYFQANTNTYTDIKTLRKMADDALSFENVVGITFSTRTDCLDDEKVAFLQELNQKTDVCVEFGLQSIHNKTLEFINRCQTFEGFEKEYLNFKKSGIRTCIHIINGLPYESYDMMIKTAKKVGELNPDGLKIHSLHITKGTKLASIYENKPFDLFDKQTYIKLVANQLTLIAPEVVIERVTGDGDKSKLIAPNWSKDKISVLGGLDKFMKENDLFQGKNL